MDDVDEDLATVLSGLSYPFPAYLMSQPSGLPHDFDSVAPLDGWVPPAHVPLEFPIAYVVPYTPVHVPPVPAPLPVGSAHWIAVVYDVEPRQLRVGGDGDGKRQRVDM